MLYSVRADIPPPAPAFGCHSLQLVGLPWAQFLSRGTVVSEYSALLPCTPHTIMRRREYDYVLLRHFFPQKPGCKCFGAASERFINVLLFLLYCY